MKFISWNLNGIRAAARRSGFEDWLQTESPDVLSVQETKARPEQLSESLRHPKAYHSYWHSAVRPGYSGVAIFSKREPLDVTQGLGDPQFDDEGRTLIAEFPEFYLINGYFPHVRHDLTRLDYKLAFCRALAAKAQQLQTKKPVIVCGDYNIAHTDLDLANPKANRKNPGFLPEEKAWMDDFLALGYHDVFREAHPEQNGHYTWWSYRGTCRERNVGWRIDYQCVHQALRDRILSVSHQKNVPGSDHCPIELVLKD